MEQPNAAARQPISFEVPKEQVSALQALAAGRKVRITGEVRGGRLVVDAVSFANDSFANPLFVSVNAPFKTAQSLSA